jgi:hypothetical protein
VIVAEKKKSPELRFVVHGHRGPQFECRTYAEAEARALLPCRHAGARVWYADERGFQLVGSFIARRPPPARAGLD